MPIPVFAEPEDTQTEATDEPVIPEDAIYISTAEDLLKFAEDCIADTWSQGKTFVLSADIDLTGVEFYGVPTFGGTFYGQGHTVSGIDMQEDNSVVGFFRYVQKNAIVDGLNLEGTISPKSNPTVGAIVGCNYGTIQNCNVKATVSGSEQIGGIAGWNKTTGVIDNCTMTGLVYGDHYVGGIVGKNQGVVRDCTNLAEVNTETEHNTIGLNAITMESLTEKESIEYATNIGGIAGTNSGVIRACINKEHIGYKKMGYNVGGIAGSQTGYIADCINYAKIEGSNGVGGIVGQALPSIALNFGENPMDVMNAQMSGMMNSMDDLMDSMSGMEDMFGDTSDMEEAMEAIENAIDPETGEVDEDALMAALNDLSDKFSGTFEDTSVFADMSDTMNEMMAQMQGMMESMESLANMGFSYEDISRFDTENDIVAKTYRCTNYGEVSGETYVAGVVGIANTEATMDMEEDVDVSGELSMSGESTIRLVIRDCRNHGTIAATKDYVGGIAGYMAVGALFEGKNIGNVDALSADYVGGIAGSSDTVIFNSISKCIIAGADYVGGIAGFGTEVLNSYAVVDIAAATKFAGAVVGNTEEIPSDSSQLILNNAYCIVGRDTGGIDGIRYAGATDCITLEEFLAIADLDEMFKNVEVRFCVEGQDDIILTTELGGSISLDKVPVPNVEEGEMYDWVYEKPVTSETLAMGEVETVNYLSESRLSNILFNQIYKATFEAKNMVSKGEELTEDNRSKILAVGAFDKNTSVTLTDMLSSESVVNEKTVVENWKVEISNIGVEKLHYYIPKSMDAEHIQLFVKDATGTWAEREYMIEGSYIIFAFSDGEMGFALAQNAGLNPVMIVVAGVVIIGALVVLLKRRKASVVKESKVE